MSPLTSPTIPKAVLYYSTDSVWSLAALLAIGEKGYGDDEIDLRVVDLAKGENFSPTFLRINSKATVPTLVVPLEKTLSQDVESRYKSIAEPKAIVEFLDKSRSANSRTHTTSAAPAPSLAPATIALSATSTAVREILFSDITSPDALLFSNAHDDASLKILSKEVTPFLVGRKAALEGFIKNTEGPITVVSEKTKAFWMDNEAATAKLLEIFSEAEKAGSELSAEGKLKREEYLANAKSIWQTSLKVVLTKLDKEIIGPFALGDQLSLPDLYLTPWLARLVKLIGGAASDDGITVVRKLEERVGNGLSFPKDFSPNGALRKGDGIKQAKLAAFWDAMKERPSWKKVYGTNLR